MVATEAGFFTVTVAAGGVTADFDLTVVSLNDAQARQSLRRTDVTPWSRLAEVDLRFEGIVVHADFDPSLRALDGEDIVLSGFMLPLEAGRQQHHFLLAANPPHCYFHLPGGPSTVAEVRSERGVATSFDPVIVRGRLIMREQSDLGILYTLTDARELPNR